MPANALTQAEFEELRTWSETNGGAWPEQIQASLQRLFAVYQSLAHDKKKAADVLKTLRMAMGLEPKSERGSQALEKN